MIEARRTMTQTPTIRYGVLDTFPVIWIDDQALTRFASSERYIHLPICLVRLSAHPLLDRSRRRKPNSSPELDPVYRINEFARCPDLAHIRECCIEGRSCGWEEPLYRRFLDH
jgi:hypothetical protein